MLDVRGSGRSTKRMLLSMASGLALSMAGAAAAQEPAGDALDEVVVTASRIGAIGASAPTPTTVVGEADLERRAAVNIAEVLNEVPSFRSTNTPTTNPFLSGYGQNYVDLRSLGVTRTLVLLDGRRHVPTSDVGTVDLNLIPSILVSRMEVVTGGASAAWGSDAVAGVVNIRLKSNLQGLEGEVQYGESERGDDVTRKIALAAGTSFAGGRGHILLGGEYNGAEGASDQYTRAWGREERSSVGNAAWRTNGQPAIIYGRGVRFGNLTNGGLITAGPLAGTAFGQGGAPFQFSGGPLYGPFMFGGRDNYSISTARGAMLKAPGERFAALSRIAFEVSDKLGLFIEGSYGKATYEPVGPVSRDQGNITVRLDNAYLPAVTRAAMQANGLATFTMGRQNDDIGHIRPLASNESMRVAFGIDGKLGRWSWDAYYQYGQNDFHTEYRNNRIEANWRLAIDPVVNPANGQIVCRSTLTNPGNGCVPFNLFGSGSSSPEALRYVVGTMVADQRTKQQVAAVNVEGPVFATWAGDVVVAAGFEYRQEQIDRTVDAVSLARGYNVGNWQPIDGKYHLSEFYGEVSAPLAKDLPFLKSLDFNGAIRRTDYSTSGAVTTWKLGGTWDVNDDLRVRVARSRDIRAPNLSEMFTTTASTILGVIDPVTGVSVLTTQLTQGNRTGLRPEKADTWTAGAVYRPGWLRGFSLSVDYFDIKIAGQIAAMGGQVILDRCYAGAADICALIERGPTGTLLSIRNPQFNLNALYTSGVDIEASYRTSLESLRVPAPGNLTARFMGTYLRELVTVDTAGRADRAGQYTNGASTPDWIWNGTLSYDLGPFTATIQGRYLSAGKLNNRMVPGTATGANINDVGSTFYTNLTASYDIVSKANGRRMQVYGVVNNAFDVSPPFPFGIFESGPYFDVIGRAYRVGLRFKY